MRHVAQRLEDLAADQPYALVGGPFGSKLTSADYVEEGVPVIRGTNLNGGRYLTESDFVYVSEEKVRKDLFGNLAHPGDIVFTQRGTLGQVALIPPNASFDTYVVSQSQMKMTVNPSKADARFIYYWFTSPEVIGALVNRNASSGVPHINLTVLRNFLIRTPEPHVQTGIADFLSNYDDLIENNNRRIALLEEATRLLYREWFIHRRFPGHEHTTREGKLPKGWRATTFAEACSSLEDGDWIESKDQGGSDYRLLQISNIGTNEFVETGNYRYVTEETFARLNCRELLPGHILIARMPKPIGRAWLVTEMPWKMITAVDGAIAIANPAAADPYFLTYFLNSPANLALCERRAVGATRPRITRRDVASLPLTLPTLALQRLFRDVAEPANRQRQLLQQKNGKLAQARDLLLPRLMRGEIEV